VEARHAASHGEIVAEGPVSVDLRKIGKNALDEVHGVGPLRVPSEFGLDPRGIRRFGGNLVRVRIWCGFGHETFDRPVPARKACRMAIESVDPLDYSVFRKVHVSRRAGWVRESRRDGQRSLLESLHGALA
jgi:hypothetical protein